MVGPALLAELPFAERHGGRPRAHLHSAVRAVVGLGDAVRATLERPARPRAQHRTEHRVGGRERLDDGLARELGAQREVGVGGVVDAERRDAQRAPAQHLVHVAPVARRVAHLGHQQRVVGPLELVQRRVELHRLRVVDVWRGDVDVRRDGLVDADHVVRGPAAGEVVLPRCQGRRGVALRVVHVHRQVVDGASGLGDLLDVAGDCPGVEVFVGIVTIDLAPGSGGRQRHRRLLVLQHGGRHRLFERCLRLGCEVAHEAVRADLVLHLHHQHRVMRLVDLPEVRHERDEGLAVGLQGLVAERRQAVAELALRVHHARKALVVELDPFRRIGRAGVLPRAEPQQHQVLAVLARLRQQGIDVAEVETALHRLDLLPRHRDLDRIRVHVRRRRPHLVQHRRIVAGVVDLDAQHREGRAVHHQGGAAVARFQMRGGVDRGRGLRAGGAGRRQRGEREAEKLAHRG